MSVCLSVPVRRTAPEPVKQLQPNFAGILPRCTIERKCDSTPQHPTGWVERWLYSISFVFPEGNCHCNISAMPHRISTKIGTIDAHVLPPQAPPRAGRRGLSVARCVSRKMARLTRVKKLSPFRSSTLRLQRCRHFPLNGHMSIALNACAIFSVSCILAVLVALYFFGHNLVEIRHKTLGAALAAFFARVERARRGARPERPPWRWNVRAPRH